MKIHRNLLWIRGESILMEEILADSKISAMIVARPAPDTCAIRRNDHGRFVERMKKLGQGHREVGKWK